MTTIYDLYDLRGELLDTKYEAAIQERPFYLQPSLDDINEQIHLIENITPEAQAEYFRTDSDGRNEIENAQIAATFGKVKVTTTAEWRKRHLHQTAEQVEAARVQAEALDKVTTA